MNCTVPEWMRQRASSDRGFLQVPPPGVLAPQCVGTSGTFDTSYRVSNQQQTMRSSFGWSDRAFLIVIGVLLIAVSINRILHRPIGHGYDAWYPLVLLVPLTVAFGASFAVSPAIRQLLTLVLRAVIAAGLVAAGAVLSQPAELPFLITSLLGPALLLWSWHGDELLRSAMIETAELARQDRLAVRLDEIHAALITRRHPPIAGHRRRRGR